MSATPDYTPKSNEAEWHITYKCDLSCPNCNRLCFLPPTTPDMTLDDAREFVRQARELNWFPKVVILGGEPTLHRELFEFIQIAHELSPGRVEVWSNGYRPAAKEKLARIRAEGVARVCEETIKADGDMVLPQADFFLAPKDFGVINHRPCGHRLRHLRGRCWLYALLDRRCHRQRAGLELAHAPAERLVRSRVRSSPDLCALRCLRAGTRHHQPPHCQVAGTAWHAHVAYLGRGSAANRKETSSSL
jgi:hypothetical protein